MAIQILDAEITAVQKATLEGAITTIKTTLGSVAVVNLSKEERQGMNTIDDDRLPYVASGIDHANNNPNLQPSFTPFADAKKDWDLMMELRGLLPKMRQAVEMMEDMSMLAEHETYLYFLDFYANVQQAVKRNVPGIDTINDDIKPLFEKTSNPKPEDVTPTEPTDPTPPTP